MALTKAQKDKKVAALAADLEHSTSAIVGTFKGLTASKDFALRQAVRSAGGSYHVVKNKLAAKSSEGTKVEQALQGLKGVSSVAYTSGDPVALAKALSTWVKDNAEFTFKLGIVDGKVITVDEIGDLAKLPSKEEIFSKLLYLIQAPAQRLATVINATSRNLAIVINQGVEKEKFVAGSAPAAAAPEQAPKAEEQTPSASERAASEPVPSVPAAEVPVEQVSAAHAEEAPTPAEQIAAHPASEADPQAEQPGGAAQPENGTASQAGEAASTDPVEG